MFTDRSRPIIHRFSNFLIPTSKFKLDHHTHLPKSPIRYHMDHYQAGVGLGIFAALDRYSPVAGSAVVRKCAARNGDQKMMMKQKRGGCSIFSLRVEEDFEAFPGPEFLTCCNLCRKTLSGKDIYMYRGVKAYCSEECRAVQIAKDERKEHYRSLGVSGLVVVGARSSPASGRDQMLSTGIFAM